MARTRTRSLEKPEENNGQDQAVPAVSDSRRRRSRSEQSQEVQPATRKDRPTPSQRQVKPKGSTSGLISRIPVVRTIVGYLRGVASEIQKVTWPTREEATRLTSVVLAVTVAFAVSLGLLDVFLSWWFQQAFSKDSETIFLIVGAVVAAITGSTYTVLRNRV